MSSSAPLIGFPACRPASDPSGHRISDRYMRAIVTSGAGHPVIIPASGDHIDTETIVERLDGVVLTGSVSNIEAWRYGKSAPPPCKIPDVTDPGRDSVAIGLIRAALRKSVPLLAICRGIQELNVALGGSLHPRLHEVNGFFDHRSPKEAPLALRFAPAHPIHIKPGGWLSELVHRWKLSDTAHVNSLHGQGIDRLACGLAIEAQAPDGVIEAVRVDAAPIMDLPRLHGFAVGVQWHPEWAALADPLSRAIFLQFAGATHDFVRARHRPS